ncbi:hypothetical protein C1Y40_05469 [Mycobacterium talmoniae]|uniref:Uncharacterized protein n=1 Tax=Mycobacterium talmoniae TaxID=1858794 RepID=A0A2S8BCI0_9MYCO|nr:hypothetical protein C1Y40_05469 [Mycobacterium talmoniae]
MKASSTRSWRARRWARSWVRMAPTSVLDRLVSVPSLSTTRLRTPGRQYASGWATSSTRTSLVWAGTASWDTPSKSTSIRCRARRRRVAIATRSTAIPSRAPTSSVSANTPMYSAHSGQPIRPISPRMVAVGRPSGPGMNSRLAIAIPAPERREHRGDGDRLPQHDRGPRCAQRPGRPGEQHRYRSHEQHREDDEGQRGHAASLPQVPGLPPIGGGIRCLASSSSSARRSASASSAPTRSTKCTSAACRLPESAA